jgi:hypothetical protein
VASPPKRLGRRGTTVSDSGGVAGTGRNAVSGGVLGSDGPLFENRGGLAPFHVAVEQGDDGEDVPRAERGVGPLSDADVVLWGGHVGRGE